MSKNIVINKKDSEGYTPYYPENNAYNVKRTTNDISYIQGNNLLEVMQDISNKYVAPRGEQWSDNVDIKEMDAGADSQINANSSICSVNNFICILTPYDSGNIHRMNMLVSYNGGKTWELGYYSNTNTRYRISNIVDTVATLGSSGDYEVLLVGTIDSSSTLATTYTLTFQKGGIIPASVKRFSNQIDLLDSEVTA